MAYGLNWIYHDVFGIIPAEWRQTQSQNTVLGNVTLIRNFMINIVSTYGLGNEFFGFFVFTLAACSFYCVFLRDRLEALFAFTPVFMGIALLFYYAIINGVTIPTRATIFVWLCSAYVLVRTGMIIGARSRVFEMLGFLVVGIIAVLLVFRADWNSKKDFLRWQAATMELASFVPPQTQKILVYGPIDEIDGAAQAGIMSEQGLSSRLQYLTGIPVYICNFASTPCESQKPPFNPKYTFADNVDGVPLIRLLNGTMFIRLPRKKAQAP
jgi:hypothetical protein